jgi:hypothetical protein
MLGECQSPAIEPPAHQHIPHCHQQQAASEGVRVPEYMIATSLLAYLIERCAVVWLCVRLPTLLNNTLILCPCNNKDGN